VITRTAIKHTVLVSFLLLLFLWQVCAFTVIGKVQGVGERSGDNYTELGCDIARSAFCVKVLPLNEEKINAGFFTGNSSAELSFKAGGYYFPPVFNVDSSQWVDHNVVGFGGLPLATLLCYFNGREADCGASLRKSQPVSLNKEQPIDAFGKNGIAVFRITKITGPYVEEGSFRPFYYFKAHEEKGENVEIQFEVKFLDPETGEYVKENNEVKWFSSQQEIDEYVQKNFGERMQQIAEQLQSLSSETVQQTTQPSGMGIATSTSGNKALIHQAPSGVGDIATHYGSLTEPFSKTSDFVVRTRFDVEQFRAMQKGRNTTLAFNAGSFNYFSEPKTIDASSLNKWFSLHGDEGHSVYRFELIEFKPMVVNKANGLTESEAEAKIAVYTETGSEESQLDCSGIVSLSNADTISRFLKAGEDASEPWGQRCDKEAGWKMDGILLFKIRDFKAPYYLRDGSTYTLVSGNSNNYEIDVFFDVRFKTNHSPEFFTPEFSSEDALKQLVEGAQLTVNVLDEAGNNVENAIVSVEKNSAGLKRMEQSTDASGSVQFIVPLNFPLDLSAEHESKGSSAKSIEGISKPTTIELTLYSSTAGSYYLVFSEEDEQKLIGTLVVDGETINNKDELYQQAVKYFSLQTSSGEKIEFRSAPDFYGSTVELVLTDSEGNTVRTERQLGYVIELLNLQKNAHYTALVRMETPMGERYAEQHWFVQADGAIQAEDAWHEKS